MKIGTAYYPEYNKRDDWEKDFEKIQAAGIKRVRMGEFAWSLLQPEKNIFNWQWMDESIEMASRFGLEIVIGTPTACPPIWLVEEYPEVLPVNREGRRSGFGARQHRCYHSTAYLKHADIVVQALGERYGAHPTVAAWQIDNELGGEQKKCYCDSCRKAFQDYLHQKYTSIEELNIRWGNHFWSQDYQKWSQIPVPKRFASDMDMKHHPSLELEFARFSSQSIIDFSQRQAALLRKYTQKPITTNTDSFLYGDNVDIHALFQDLDVAAMDLYTQSPYEIAFYSDITRSLKHKPFWMMEYGTGSPNLRKEMELMKGRDCEWLYFFTFKPFTAGQEHGFKALLNLTGKPLPNYGVVKQWCEDPTAAVPSPSVYSKPKFGFYYDFDSSWSYNINTWGDNLVEKQIYPQYILNTLYRGLFEKGIPVEFIFCEKDIHDLDVLFLPWKILYQPNLEAVLITYVKNGGRLIVTSDLFRKNMDNVFLNAAPPIYQELLGQTGIHYIDETGSETGAVLLSSKVGRGQVWMLKKDLSLEEWKTFLLQI